MASQQHRRKCLSNYAYCNLSRKNISYSFYTTVCPLLNQIFVGTIWTFLIHYNIYCAVNTMYRIPRLTVKANVLYNNYIKQNKHIMQQHLICLGTSENVQIIVLLWAQCTRITIAKLISVITEDVLSHLQTMLSDYCQFEGWYYGQKCCPLLTSYFGNRQHVFRNHISQSKHILCTIILKHYCARICTSKSFSL